MCVQHYHWTVIPSNLPTRLSTYTHGRKRLRLPKSRLCMSCITHTVRYHDLSVSHHQHGIIHSENAFIVTDYKCLLSRLSTPKQTTWPWQSSIKGEACTQFPLYISSVATLLRSSSTRGCHHVTSLQTAFWAQAPTHLTKYVQENIVTKDKTSSQP